MSIEQLGEKEFARRNLWEATLFDENHNPIIWSTGLIKSTNIPKLSFVVEDILAGTSKGYMGWKLPDNLSISIWETSDHTVEKYLDEWMMGKTGIFNPETGAFHVQPSEDYLYRDVRIKTFIYEYTEDKPYQVKKKDVISALALTMLDGLHEQVGAVTVEQQEYVYLVSEMAVTSMGKLIANNNDNIYLAQNTPGQDIVTVDKKQVIPVLDKITAAVSSLANQMITRHPIGSDITSLLIPPVVIPPPLLKIPLPTGEPFPLPPMNHSGFIQLHDKVEEQKQKVALTILDGIQKKVEDILVDFAAGEATKAKQWKASEKVTSLVTYSTAIEGYDIGTYDYSTGEGVSYIVNLAVRDLKIEYPD